MPTSPPAYPVSGQGEGTGGMRPLRAWQAHALRDYRASDPRDFLAVATPGAGKTTFALRVAKELLDRRVIDRIVVVAPTEHLKTQWALAADGVGLALDPSFGTRSRSAAGYHGFALTYAGVAANPHGVRARVEGSRCLVVLDEIHHAGDARAWGDAVKEAFEPAKRRLSLTGTPFRSDANPIPFVRYEPDGHGGLRSAADHTYGYAEALAEGVVRPVMFLAYSGDVHWRTRAGDEIAARLGQPLTTDLSAQALRTALDPEGAWIPMVLRAADTRLSEIRHHMPDAGGLVIASDQTQARAYAEILRQITRRKPALVLSDEPGSSKTITRFAVGDSRWMVAVRMVSEGVDVPRLAVGVYATNTLTPLFFAQAVGRFVRARSRGETATVFLPSVEPLLRHAAALEEQRDHVLRLSSEGVLDAADLADAAERLADEQDADDAEEGAFTALASEADFDRVVFDGGEYGVTAMAGSDEEQDYLGLPGLLDADQVRELLRRRQSEQVARRIHGPDNADPAPVAQFARLRELRKELNGLVGAWHHRTDVPHGVIHATLREETGGGPAAAASAEELQARIDRLRQWAVRRSS